MIEWVLTDGSLKMTTTEENNQATWTVPVPEWVANDDAELIRFTDLHVEAFAELLEEATHHAA